TEHASRLARTASGKPKTGDGFEGFCQCERAACYANGQTIGGEFTLATQSARKPEDCRLEEKEHFQQALCQIQELIAAHGMCDFVRQDGVERFAAERLDPALR